MISVLRRLISDPGYFGFESILDSVIEHLEFLEANTPELVSDEDLASAYFLRGRAQQIGHRVESSTNSISKAIEIVEKSSDIGPAKESTMVDAILAFKPLLPRFLELESNRQLVSFPDVEKSRWTSAYRLSTAREQQSIESQIEFHGETGVYETSELKGTFSDIRYVSLEKGRVRVLGIWEASGATGTFDFTVSTDRRSFAGVFDFLFSGNRGTWTGRRIVDASQEKPE